MVPINNLAETLAMISQCDAVVTSDTVTAHLGAALGVPTLMCLLRWPDWRWGTPDRPTHWYHSARLLFQDESQSWPPVLASAADYLASATTTKEPR